MQAHRIPSYKAERLVPFVGRPRVEELSSRLGALAECLRGRRVVNVTGDDRRKGGVYELMRTTLPYLRGGGVAVEWVGLPTRLEDRPALEFFHFLAHGTVRGAEWRRELPARTVELRTFGRSAASELASILRPSDLLILHDTQSAPLVEELADWRDQLIWHAHVGTVERNPAVAAYWDVLSPSVAKARARIFHRAEFVPRELLAGSVFVEPSLDPSAPKSVLMERGRAGEALSAGLAPLRWIGAAPSINPEASVALQISRWDLLKDMPGAARVLGTGAERRPQLVGLVVGPAAQSDIEKSELEATVAAREGLGRAARSRLHIGVIESSGSAAHDLAVQALQARADVVLQKSRQEGFGLTVTEAMFRGKPVVATGVGGISLQIEDGRNGVTLPPQASDDQWAEALEELIEDGTRRLRLGEQARADVLERRIVDRQLSALIRELAPLMA
jgi:trehalose synthase